MINSSLNSNSIALSPTKISGVSQPGMNFKVPTTGSALSGVGGSGSVGSRSAGIGVI